MRTFVITVLLATVAWAGCLSSDAPPGEDEGTGRPAPVVDPDGTLRLDVPVDVLLLGFPDTAVATLEQQLDSEEVVHEAFSYSRNFATDRVDGGASYQIPVPIVPTAQYRIHASAALDEGYWATAAGTQVEPGLLNGTAIEAWLETALPQHGHTPDPSRPMLVLVHAGDRMGTHTYRYHGNLGYMDNVRLFGERLGFIVADLSAEADPYQGTARDYQSFVDPAEAAAAAEDLVRDVTHFRLLQGAIYPVALAPCHAVTLILGVRAAAVTELLPGFTTSSQSVALERLARHFENLTGDDNVHVDLKVLLLPQDDPVLDALARDRQDLSAFRFWLDENWDQYWVPHDGCEPYVSFALYGDFGDQPTSFSGIAMYDVDRSHRISFSIVSELTRVQSEWPGFHEAVDGIVSTAEAGRAPDEWFNRLYSHETGHLFGQRHPHDINKAGGSDSTRAFSSVWSTMSYQVRGVVDDFGAVDQANFARNRAGFAHQAVVEAGLTEEAAYEEALALLGQYQWQAAGDLFVDLLQADAGSP